MENLKTTETSNTLISILCIVPLSLMHERRINVKKTSQGVRVPAAKVARSGFNKNLRAGAYSFPACCPAPKGQCEGQASKCT